jgi:outer membrane protein OmpA-like peptidoglycan-associated protein/peptidoglycan hydrolase-like protein with peptidoglycan-binding domain
MPNRLEELAKSLGPAATRTRERRGRVKRKMKAKAPAPATTPAAPSTPAAPNAAARPAAPTAPAATASPAIAKALAAVDYSVPGVLVPLAQPSGKTCWATVTTMMLSWRDQVSYTIPGALEKAGSAYVTKFKNDQGLATADKPAFLAAAGLAYQLPQSLTAAGWEALLRRYGPLWVTTDEKPGAGFSIHARIMTGIHGDGTPAGTSIDIIDPSGGKAYKENFGTFVTKFESEALDPKRPVRIQIVHFASGTNFKVSLTQALRSAAYAQALESGRFATVDDAEFEPPYREGHRGRHGARAHSAFAHGLAAPKTLGAADVRWAADADSIDYRHLGVAIDTKPFDLTAEVLERLARFNRFVFRSTDTKVVFGLRGCTLDASAGSFSDRVSVREIEPNHIDNRCVIGVWDRGANKVVAFQASTVPNWEYMESYRENHAKKANLQPTGRYHLTVGTHRAKKKNAAGELVDNPNRIQGALRNDQEIVVLRSEDDLSYTVRDTWDKTVPNDNIHPGIVAVNPGSSTVPDYSSAGCNTIPGSSVSDTPAGDWADFRRALGLDNARPTANDGETFGHMLLTGREARCVSNGNTSLGRLRFGSRGDEVRQLQEAMARHAKKYYTGKSDGEFGPGTAMAFIKYQKDVASGAADGIVTPAQATALGFTLGAGPATTSVAKQLDVIGSIVDFARGIFKKKIRRPDDTKFVVESEIAEIMHDDTPAIAQWKKTTFTWKLKTASPRSGVKDALRGDLDWAKTYTFTFRGEFEHNGYDIRNAQVQRVAQESSGLNDQKFTAKFSAKKATPLSAQTAQIDFLLNGKWDPAIGNKNYDFSGRLQFWSDGRINFDLDKNENVKVEFKTGGTFWTLNTVKLAAPKIRRVWHAVMFDPQGSDTITEKEMKLLKDWVKTLQADRVLWTRITAGTVQLKIEGYASATGKGQFNQDLSGKRADKVIKLLKDYMGPNAKLNRFAYGEDDPTVPKILEKDDPAQRRAEVSFELVG